MPTDRLVLPLLVQAQAQKETTHNEALALVDLALFPSVEQAGRNDPPAAPVPGQGWIVGAAPQGAWSGKGGMLAGWTSGGWRFVPVPVGGQVWNRQSGQYEQRTATGWASGQISGAALHINGKPVVGAQKSAIADIIANGAGDGEARQAINAILAVLRGHGLIASA